MCVGANGEGLGGERESSSCSTFNTEPDPGLNPGPDDLGQNQEWDVQLTEPPGMPQAFQNDCMYGGRGYTSTQVGMKLI